MSVTLIQSQVTKTAPFNGSAVDISALGRPFEVILSAGTLLQAGAVAIFQLQTSSDVSPFSSDIRVEKTYTITGPVEAIAPFVFSLRDFDLPSFRVGLPNCHARLILAYLDAGPLTLAAPGTVTPTPSASGGTLAAATYKYKVTALGNGGESLPSPEASAVTSGSTGSVALAWAAVTGATSYRIYRGTTVGGENVFYTSSTNSFTDTNATSTGGTPPTSNSTGSPSVSYSAAIKS